MGWEGGGARAALSRWETGGDVAETATGVPALCSPSLSCPQVAQLEAQLNVSALALAALRSAARKSGTLEQAADGAAKCAEQHAARRIVAQERLIMSLSDELATAAAAQVAFVSFLVCV